MASETAFQRVIHGLWTMSIDWWWWTFANGFCNSVVLPAVLILLALILANQVGRGVGLPLLLWVGGREGRPVRWRQFLIGIGVATLVWQVLLAGYMAEEFASNTSIDRPPFCEIRAPFDWGLDHEDFPGRFRYLPTDLRAFLHYGAVILGSLAATGALVAGLVGALLWLTDRSGAPFRRRWVPFTRTRDIPPPPYSAWLPLGSLAGVILMAWAWVAVVNGPGRPATVAVGRFAVERSGGWGHQSGRQAWLGKVIDARAEEARHAGTRDLAALDARATLATSREDLRGWRNPFSRDAWPYADPTYIGARAAALRWYQPYYPIFGLFLLTFLVVLLYTVGLALALGRTSLMTPAGWILVILQIAVFVSAAFAYFIPINNQSGLILLAGLAVLAGRTYKLRFPNLPFGDEPVPLPAAYERMRKADEARQRAEDRLRLAGRAVLPVGAAPPAVGPGRSIRSNDIPYARRAWCEVVKPPMALVCVSGGGSRSALWVMSVLKALEAAFLEGRGSRYPQVLFPPVAFPYHVRLMTGASGGMLAAAAYAANLRPPIAGQVEADRLRSLDQLIAGTKENFLAAVAHQLGSWDLWSVLRPGRLKYDRGWAIEDSWRLAFPGVMDRTFADLWQGEREGWRPSLIFSPMLVEDGRQLFISNLSLRSVTRNLAWVEDDTPPDSIDGRKLLSREGVEFFELFRAARPSFQVGTAARMSGSFPYVLPASVLPTNPPRRVVDAGYYDNYGVGIATAWLAEHLDWVREHTSGVILIQIRDGESVASRRREQVDDPFPTLVSRGLQWATSPPEGLWQSRVATHVFRNDHLLHLMTERLRDLGFPDHFFTTATFEFERGDDVSLSWTLTEKETTWVAQGLNQIEPRVRKVVDWWHSR